LCRFVFVLASFFPVSFQFLSSFWPGCYRFGASDLLHHQIGTVFDIFMANRWSARDAFVQKRQAVVCWPLSATAKLSSARKPLPYIIRQNHAEGTILSIARQKAAKQP